MKPTEEQVHRALLNYYKPLRTPGAKLRDAVQHAEKSRAISPAQDIFAQMNRCTTTEQTRKDKPCPRCKV